jgi:putative spermidine/putrescine transport system substrate-binding protein
VFVKGGPNADLGAAFMNRVLEPKIQQGLAEAALAAPSVDGIEFKPEIAKLLAYPQKKMDELGLFSPDWAFVNKERSGWIEKMGQIFVS